MSGFQRRRFTMRLHGIQSHWKSVDNYSKWLEYEFFATSISNKRSKAIHMSICHNRHLFESVFQYSTISRGRHIDAKTEGISCRSWKVRHHKLSQVVELIWNASVLACIKKEARQLGGGNSNYSFYVHPENWGRFPFWRISFSDGWFNHQIMDGTTPRWYLCDLGQVHAQFGPQRAPGRSDRCDWSCLIFICRRSDCPTWADYVTCVYVCDTW